MHKPYVEDVLGRMDRKVTRMIEQMGDKSPHVAGQDGKFDDIRLCAWTSGFWAGILWIMHDMTGKDHYREAAWGWDEKIERRFFHHEQNFHHDVGFQFLPTAVIKYKITGDHDSFRRALRAANFLAGRFNPAGKFIRAWNGDKLGWSIIDSMMNLSLLYWASEKSLDPRYKHIATAHANTVIEHFIRPDGSVNHIVSFDPETGAFIESLGGQGYGPYSSWSRGQAWALYGMVNTFSYTGDRSFLAAAKRVAHYFLASMPEDAVPYWDFRAEPFADQPRDSSAGAIAASGLIEISKCVPSSESCIYMNAAKKILFSLTEQYATWHVPDHEAILLHGTGHKPENKNVDVSLIYGDYFYVEAMAKLTGWKQNIF
jgi:unsaturated chondroitin disaccharide hydrolase